MKTQSSKVRFIGLLYLLVIICAGFSQGYVRANIVVPDDAALTASNILENIMLFRVGLAADLFAFILDAIISVMLYQLLKPYGKMLAMVSSSLRLLAHPAIGALNLLNHFMAYHVLSQAGYLSAFEPEQLESLSLLFMDAHRYGYLIAGGFFGFHCFILGYLLIKSDLIPSFFGWMMIVAAIGYLMETFGDFLYPGNEVWLAWVVGLSAALGEVELTLYMLIKGTKNSTTQNSEI
ncbi:DUF4386 domain-containing protein [Fulvivirga lutimaris]|uniref:DUF4386 domain-containing protein n=1 Tax=Fulvivirga lutimaris TaxID=1819566 RepID=UPI0012BBB876|nr:DUF4386 domain-containing protein [Fulvivirga lutimaris]MTI38059.1 DUF4386 domain-containing protein [Fulvivirga lutimaris]